MIKLFRKIKRTKQLLRYWIIGGLIRTLSKQFPILWWNYGLRWLFGGFDRSGFYFFRKCDEVIWLWPWRRTRKEYKWLSVIGDGLETKSLKEIDDFWREFELACLNINESDGDFNV
jgi:hypothetical protein